MGRRLICHSVRKFDRLSKMYQRGCLSSLFLWLKLIALICYSCENDNNGREIKNSTWDGYIRVFFRTMIIAILLVISFLDYQHGKLPLSEIYDSIKNELTFGFYSDDIIKPMYDRHIIIRQVRFIYKNIP